MQREVEEGLVLLVLKQILAKRMSGSRDLPLMNVTDGETKDLRAGGVATPHLAMGHMARL